MSLKGVDLQIMTLVKQGHSVEDAAEALGVNPEAAALMVRSTQKEPVTPQELLNRFKPEAINILMEIARYGENESARVKAATVILQEGGQLPVLRTSVLEEYLNRSRKAIEIVDVEPVTKELTN